MIMPMMAKSITPPTTSTSIGMPLGAGDAAATGTGLGGGSVATGILVGATVGSIVGVAVGADVGVTVGAGVAVGAGVLVGGGVGVKVLTATINTWPTRMTPVLVMAFSVCSCCGVRLNWRAMALNESPLFTV